MGGGFFSPLPASRVNAINLPAMAVVKHPITMTTVKRYRGTLDFYFQRGQQIVRSWPKKSNLVPTPAQKVQRDNFRAIECCLKAQGPQQRAAWKAWRPSTGQNWVDFVHRVWMKPAADGTLFTMPDFTRYWMLNTGPGQGRGLFIEWDASRWTDPRRFDIVCSPCPAVPAKWGWSVKDYKIQRGRFRQPRWTPRFGEFVVLNSFGWRPETGRVHFRTPSAWPRILFACIPAGDPDPEHLITACMIAEPLP